MKNLLNKMFPAPVADELASWISDRPRLSRLYVLVLAIFSPVLVPLFALGAGLWNGAIAFWHAFSFELDGLLTDLPSYIGQMYGIAFRRWK